MKKKETTMKHAILVSTVLLLVPLAPILHASAAGSKPNILFIIADDASQHIGEAYGCQWVKMPNMDRLAKNGLIFDNVYTPSSKCSPSRAAIMTGRNPWQLEDAANHAASFPAKFMAFSEALNKAGIATGGDGKTWGPGVAKKADGSPRNFALNAGSDKIGNNPGNTFAKFLNARPKGTPFLYWFGSHYPHRGYKLDSGVKAGKKIEDIDRVPAYWPDNDVIRRDMLDYAMEVQAFDAQIGSLLTALDATGEAKNTLIIVTSDNGMPFPRVKGHTFDDANRMPFVACWPEGIAKPGRRVEELISFIDLAPTFLELFGVDGQAQGMSPITGSSFADLLRNEPMTRREFVMLGRERNDPGARPGSPSGLGYPARAIREGNFLYIRNFEPDRWPCGDIDRGLRDTDGSPSKTFIENLGEQDPFWQQAFGKRPSEQLFDIATDPDCMKNLATDRAFVKRAVSMRDLLMTELTKQTDPRALGHGDVFDQYIRPGRPEGETKEEAMKEKKAKK